MALGTCISSAPAWTVKRETGERKSKVLREYRRVSSRGESNFPDCVLYSRFSSLVIKTKNRNRSINKFKNLGYDR